MRWISNLIPTLVYTVPAVLIAISLHEFAHGWASWKLGDPTPRRPGGSPSTRYATSTRSAPSACWSSTSAGQSR